jgi:hypothetical protein
MSAVSADGKLARGTLSGTVTKNAIAFLFNWKNQFVSVTAWSGLVLSDGEALAIYALWHLASTSAKGEDVWDPILVGANQFYFAGTAI